ncbi:laccase-11-like [Cryptomeria japonica]|uniref:laccase-11-like n=1 Tax=Cryptomeria japonica TaxID=3369 RepID=UPI0027D9F022|nr:laccase-11-like [Cryptomeria japonica]
MRLKNYTRLCHTKPIVTVNGRYPGPTIYAREGDTVLVNVTNHVKYNVTIHWHGIRQLRTGWADGPAYITQCPIQTRQSFVYNFTITGQRGTLFYHAHIMWLRATLYGPIVISPKKHVPYPFPKPHKEVTLVLGEWWNADTEAVINQALKSGGAPNASDAHTINGKPGPLFNCSTKDTYALAVESDKTYLLRFINAALNDQVFFSIANHLLTVVEVDAVYTKPFKTQAIAISPGQTTNVLLNTDKKAGRCFMAVRAFMDAPIPVDNMTAVGILQYIGTPNTSNPIKPVIPKINDTAFYTNFSNSLKSLNSVAFPAKVPKTVDRNLLFTIGLALDSCPTCVNGNRASASINNVSFIMPTIALLQAHCYNISGVFTKDFPDNPPTSFNYTGTPPKNIFTSKGTRLTSLTYNSTVQLVLQDTSILIVDNHPIHLHGFNFFIVGSGFGNYNPNKDPAKFNLVDPLERNTVGVPTGGWTAIRFRADNLGGFLSNLNYSVSKVLLFRNQPEKLIEVLPMNSL